MHHTGVILSTACVVLGAIYEYVLAHTKFDQHILYIASRRAKVNVERSGGPNTASHHLHPHPCHFPSSAPAPLHVVVSSAMLATPTTRSPPHPPHHSSGRRGYSHVLTDSHIRGHPQIARGVFPNISTSSSSISDPPPPLPPVSQNIN